MLSIFTRVLMDNFSPAQYDRFEAYRRHALPKQAVRKVRRLVCDVTCAYAVALGYPTDPRSTGVSTRSPDCRRFLQGFRRRSHRERFAPTSSSMTIVSQQLARAVQQRRGETGPLSPDHLREAYRLYQKETGRVGAARPLRSKRVFVK